MGPPAIGWILQLRGRKNRLILRRSSIGVEKNRGDVAKPSGEQKKNTATGAASKEAEFGKPHSCAQMDISLLPE